MATAVAAGSPHRVLLHVINRVADQRSNSLTILAIFLLYRLIDLPEAAMAIVCGHLGCQIILVVVILVVHFRVVVVRRGASMLAPVRLLIRARSCHVHLVLVLVGDGGVRVTPRRINVVAARGHRALRVLRTLWPGSIPPRIHLFGLFFGMVLAIF